jgi:metal-responsive CopG/Arc/MetJ family transcriptional regulator
MVYLEWISITDISEVSTMAAISLKLPDELAETSGEYAQELKISRSEYIRRAVEEMNKKTRTRLRAQRLAEASRRVRKESMRVNAEFAEIEGDPDA